MKRLLFSLFVLASSVSPSWGAGLTLSIHDGLVSIDAQDVTVRQILTEWARIGKTRIINVERITGSPITVKLDKVPEKQALDVILRSIPGYMALPRATQVADASQYERILIMATTTAVAALKPAQQAPGFPGMQGGPGGSLTQLRPNMPTPMIPGMLDAQDPADQMDDPAIAAAAAAGLVPVPGFNPGASPFSAPLMPPFGSPQPQPQPAPAQTAPGAGAPTNPWGIPVGTAQPSLAPPEPVATPNPNLRVRPPQPDR